jgi:glucosamine--fructose-6-phosphate aminotransferase (isomerizing)
MEDCHMSSEQMMSRIAAQARSLEAVLAHHGGEGRAALAQAAQVLGSRCQIVITGMGASFYAALPLESQLCAAGINAVAIEAGELLHFRLAGFRDAAILIVSRSGESIEITRLLEILKGRQPIVGVTNRPQSTLFNEADVAINIASLNDDIVALQTYTGTLLVLALLLSALDNSLAETFSLVQESLPAFDGLVRLTLQQLHNWDSFLIEGSSLYLLARGASYASALEGALLLNEVAKFSCVAMSAASFRHGPAEVVDSNFRGLLFVPEDATQSLNLSLARDLRRFGGDVRIIGPAATGFDELPTIALPAAPARLAPLFEIVPLQAAALRLAELRGLVPGAFRFVPPVALDEASFGPL